MQRGTGVQPGQQGSLLPSCGKHQVVLHLVNSEGQRVRERRRGSLCEGVCAFDCVIVCMCLSVCEYVRESDYL